MKAMSRMVNSVTWRRMLFVGCMLSFAFLAWNYSGYQRGRLVASLDLKFDRFRVMAIGPPSPGGAEYAMLLQSRYGVELDGAGCVMTTRLIDYIQGYNEVSVPGIEAMFKKNIFSECRKDAQVLRVLNHKLVVR
ncbi:hypothetical protein BH10PLA2_BH10PLA2_07930 [soil metagenome]